MYCVLIEESRICPLTAGQKKKKGSINTEKNNSIIKFKILAKMQDLTKLTESLLENCINCTPFWWSLDRGTVVKTIEEKNNYYEYIRKQDNNVYIKDLERHFGNLK